MRYNKNLLRRFGGSVRAIEDYCKGSGKPAIHELNAAYERGAVRVYKESGVVYKRPPIPKRYSYTPSSIL